MQKFSMHIHTIRRSPCGKVEPERIVKLYKEKGYGGIIVTDHYMEYVFNINNIIEDKERVDFFLSGYHETKYFGDKAGLKVFLGMELNLSKYNRPNSTYPVYEFLIYGLFEKFIYNNPRLYELEVGELFKLVNDNNMLMIQSHPFRPRTECANFKFMHGVEVVNKNGRHDSFDNLALKFANEHNLLKTASDDFHEEEDLAHAGMYFPDDTDTIEKVVKYIKNGQAKNFSD